MRAGGFLACCLRRTIGRLRETHGMANRPHRSNELEIRVRETLLADGTRSWHSTVLCPRQKRSTAVIDCFRCQGYSEFAFDEGGCGVLRCRESHDPVREQESQIPKKGTLDRRASVHLLAERTPISALIAARVRCVHPDVRVESLASAFLDETFSSSVSVVDEAGTPIGVVSRRDLPRHDRRGSGVSRPTVRKIMRPITLALDERVSVSRALRHMVAKAVHRVPVVDSRGSVVGVLSVSDILRWLGPSLPTPSDR